MRVQNIERNNLNQFTWKFTKFFPITKILKTSRTTL